MGGFAFYDGANLVLSGLDGVPRGTALGNLGQSIAGDMGQYGGELANLAPGVISLASDVPGGPLFMMDGVLFMANVVSNKPCH